MTSPETEELCWVFVSQQGGRYGLFPYAKRSEGFGVDPEYCPGPDIARLVFWGPCKSGG